MAALSTLVPSCSFVDASCPASRRVSNVHGLIGNISRLSPSTSGCSPACRPAVPRCEASRRFEPKYEGSGHQEDGASDTSLAMTVFRGPPLSLQAFSKDQVGASLAIVPFDAKEDSGLQIMSKDQAMGIVLSAVLGCASGSHGWTTSSGMEGPPSSFPSFSSSSPIKGGTDPPLSRSPRRRLVVEFTCNKCGDRTRRAINPHAYNQGTVFVQCKGCDIFHKLVDHLKLFHEFGGQVFPDPADPLPFTSRGFTFGGPFDQLPKF